MNTHTPPSDPVIGMAGLERPGNSETGRTHVAGAASCGVPGREDVLSGRPVWSYSYSDHYRAEVWALLNKRVLGHFERKGQAPLHETFDTRREAIRWAEDHIRAAYAEERAEMRTQEETRPTMPARTMRPGDGTETAFGTRTLD